MTDCWTGAETGGRAGRPARDAKSPNAAAPVPDGSALCRLFMPAPLACAAPRPQGSQRVSPGAALRAQERSVPRKKAPPCAYTPEGGRTHHCGLDARVQPPEGRHRRAGVREWAQRRAGLAGAGNKILEPRRKAKALQAASRGWTETCERMPVYKAAASLQVGGRAAL